MPVNLAATVGEARGGTASRSRIEERRIFTDQASTAEGQLRRE
jgi:hypothetical protein